MWSRPSARSPTTGCRDPQRAARAAVEPRQGLSRSVGHLGQAHGGRERRAGARARPAGQALRRSGMVEQPVLRLPQAGLSADGAMGGPAGARRPGARPAYPAEGRILCAPDRQRDCAVELRADQSGAAARDDRLERREPRARHAHAGRGHRGRPRQSQDPAVRFQDVRGRPQPRAHAGQGDLPERSDAADPVSPSTATVLAAAAADRAALDQQVLHPRSHAGEILHQMVRRRRA